VVGTGGVIPQSLLDGILSSNGHVFLLNPSGVVIGPSARIDVAGFLASSLNLSNEDFLNGRMRFSEVAGAGAVKNSGAIETAAGGRVFLIAPSVENAGVIHAPGGQIVLAAGKSAELISENSPFVTVRVSADAEQALNVGTLISESGRIGMYGALVRNAGVAEANSAVVGANGEIGLVGTKGVTLEAGSRTSASGSTGGNVLAQATEGTTTVKGTVEATGNSGKGGDIRILGLRVGVLGNGVIDASGETGGGSVLVGGDAHGANADVQNAQQTFIGADGVIRADARAGGDGGKVVVWSDGSTAFNGSISARGGATGGDGGFVETSGKRTLSFNGSVDTRAPNGKTGTLLLDPDDIVISDGNSGSQADDSAFFYGGSGGSIAFGDIGLGGSAAPITISAGSLEQLTASTNIDLQANNTITMQELVNHTLTLQQNGSVSMTAANGYIDLRGGGTASNSIKLLEPAVCL
jgi:hypothetical protein